jgi:hypothetical protein
MVVIKAIMYPGGMADRAYTLGIASLTFLGQAREDRGAIQQGERVYDVKLFKAPEFGGPSDEPRGAIWKRGSIRGHLPTARGVWDLLGGSLSQLLGSRIDRYQGLGFSFNVVLLRKAMTEMAESPECPDEWRPWFVESANALDQLENPVRGEE